MIYCLAHAVLGLSSLLVVCVCLVWACLDGAQVLAYHYKVVALHLVVVVC